MYRSTWVKGLSTVCVLVFLFALSAEAQQTKKTVAEYALGKTMLDLAIQQRLYEGAGPAEIEGMRQAYEYSQDTTQIGVTLYDDNTLLFISGDTKVSLKYRIEKNRIFAKSEISGEFIEFGFFSRNGALLTVNKKLMLDKKR